MNRRRLLAGLLCILAAGAVAWLLAEGDVLGTAHLPDDERVAERTGPDAEMGIDAPEETSEATPALEGRELATPDPSAGRGSVEVLVVGPGNVPLPGVRVEAVSQTQPEGEGSVALPRTPTATTDADGKAYFAELPYDGTVSAQVRDGTQPYRSFKSGTVVRGWFILGGKDRKGEQVLKLDTAAPVSSVAVKGPEARLEVAHGIPTRLLEISASTGNTMAAAPWAVTPYVGQGDKPELRELPRIAARATPAARNRLRMHTVERNGYVKERHPEFSTWISPAARELVAWLPHWSEAELLLTLPEGVPMRSGKDWSLAAVIDGRKWQGASAHLDGFGRVIVRGVPYLPGQEVKIHGKVKGLGRLAARGRFASDGQEPLALEATWHPFERGDVRRVKEIEAIKAARLELTTELDAVKLHLQAVSTQLIELGKFKGGITPLKIEFVGADGTVQSTEDEGKGRIHVLVRRPDGAPAAGAQIQLGTQHYTLSDKGTALLERIAPDVHALHVIGAGASFSTKVEVLAGQTTRLELDAPRGGALDVQVVDEEGRGLPFARVYVKQASNLPHADVEGRVQRIDSFTDHRGRRLLHAVQAGEVELTAVYGKRKAAVKVTAREGDTTAARLVLPLPPEKPAPKKKADTRKDGDVAAEAQKRLQESLDKARALKEALRAAEEARAREKKGK